MDILHLYRHIKRQVGSGDISVTISQKTQNPVEDLMIEARFEIAGCEQIYRKTISFQQLHHLNTNADFFANRMADEINTFVQRGKAAARAAAQK